MNRSIAGPLDVSLNGLAAAASSPQMRRPCATRSPDHRPLKLSRASTAVPGMALHGRHADRWNSGRSAAPSGNGCRQPRYLWLVCQRTGGFASPPHDGFANERHGRVEPSFAPVANVCLERQKCARWATVKSGPPEPHSVDYAFTATRKTKTLEVFGKPTHVVTTEGVKKIEHKPFHRDVCELAGHLSWTNEGFYPLPNREPFRRVSGDPSLRCPP